MSNDQWNNGQNSPWQPPKGEGSWGQPPKPQQSATEWSQQGQQGQQPQQSQQPQAGAGEWGQPQQPANEWPAPQGQTSAADWDQTRHDGQPVAEWGQQPAADEWQQGQSANEWTQQHAPQTQWGQQQGGWEQHQGWGEQQGWEPQPQGWDQQQHPTQDWQGGAGFVQQGHGSRAVRGVNPFSLNFTEFSLPRSAGVVYLVGIVAILAIWLSEFIWSVTEMGGGPLWALEAFVVGLLRAALAILVLRVILEGVIALIKIAQKKPEQE